MPKVQLKSRIEVDFEEVFNGLAQLKTNELEQFAERLLALQVRRRAQALPKAEADLLQKINQGLPAEQWQQYERLNDKLHEETITPDEHSEFLRLVDLIELADAERIGHLIELAKLRGISLDSLMDQLGLRRRTYA